MQRSKAHLLDEELLLFSDQELPTRRAARVREHVAQCELCRGRLTKLENALASFADLHEREFQAQTYPSGNSRNLLRARLSDARSRRAKFWSVMPLRLASACLALLLVVGGIFTVRDIVRARSSVEAMKAEAIALPRRTLTPGSARAVQVADLCSSQDLDNDPPVSPSLEQAVFEEYGVPASSKKDYELDYLITPALGGVDSIQNLWPQPYSSTWNARVKDQLEDHLHQLVCQGKIQLATAQSDIASNWITAYKRYFNTDQPQPTPSTAASAGSGHEWDHRNRSESRFTGIYYLTVGMPSWQPSASAAVLRRTGWLR
jgi:anti-sigma factor RsiW